MASTTKDDAPQGKVVRKPPRFKRRLEETDIVGPRGVPKILKDLSEAKFSKDNKKNLRLLLATYATWGRTIGPAFEFEEFVIKLEKFSGTRRVRIMIDTLRSGEEEYVYPPTGYTSTNNNNNTDNQDNQANTDSNFFGDHHYDNFNDIDLDEEMEFEKNNKANDQNTSTSGKVLTEEERERIEQNRLQAIQRRQAHASDAGDAGAAAPASGGGFFSSKFATMVADGGSGGFFSHKFAAMASGSASGSSKNVDEHVSNEKTASDVPASNESEILADNTGDVSMESVILANNPSGTHASSTELEVLADNSSVHPSSIESEILADNFNDSASSGASHIVPDR